MESLGFIITSHVKCEAHEECLKDCINSILKYYTQYSIVVIFSDESDLFIISNIMKIYPLIRIEKGSGPAQSTCLEYILNNNYFRTNIVIHDSMTILHHFNDVHIDDISFLWHFTNHRNHWSVIKEPESEFNLKNKIITHDDLNLYIINNFIENPSLKLFLKDLYFKKQNWVGCFGPAFVITSDFLKLLESKTNITNLFKRLVSKRERLAMESLFPLLCSYTLGKEIHNSLDGLYYDGEKCHNNWISKHISKRKDSFYR